MLDGQHRRGRRGGGGPAERRVVDVVRGAAGGGAGRRRACSAARPARLTGEMCARIAIAEIEQAAPVLQPLRVDRRRPGATTAARSTRCSAARRTTSAGAIATIDAYTGTPPRVTGINVLMQGPPRRRPGVHPRDQAARARCGRASGCAPGSRCSACAAARSPATTRSGSPPTRARGTQRVRFVGQDADQGEDGFTTIIIGDDDERDEGGDPGPAQPAASSRRRSRPPSATTASRVRIGRARAEAFRDDDFRISGTADATTRVDPLRSHCAESKR